jgi:hypothetical protein
LRALPLNGPIPVVGEFENVALVVKDRDHIEFQTQLPGSIPKGIRKNYGNRFFGYNNGISG